MRRSAKESLLIKSRKSRICKNDYN